jgi:hypothetical protein
MGRRLLRRCRAAKVACMPLSRFIVALLLTLTLTGAPVLRGIAMAAPQGPEASGPHAAHCTQGEHAADHASVPGHGDSKHGGDAHQSCDGVCCTACVSGATAAMFPTMAAAVLARSIRNPAESSLTSFSLVFLRERPPRVLSL